MTFQQMENERYQAVRKASAAGILINGLLGFLKLSIGVYSNSLTIITDSVNQFMDSVSSLASLVIAKISRRNPDPEYPRGYGRTEYFASFAISILILIAGWELLGECVQRIRTPETMNLSGGSLIFLAGSIVLKLVLSVYQLRIGKKWNYDPLTAAGKESRIDVLQSAAALLTALAAKYLHLNFDAWCALVFSLLLIKTSLEIMRKAVEDLIGKNEDSNLSDRIYDLLSGEKEIASAYDLVLHSYGPLNQYGSIKVQMRGNLPLSEAVKKTAALKKKILKETGISLTFEMRPWPGKDAETEAVHAVVLAAAMRVEGTKEINGFYCDREVKEISFDATVDYTVRDLRAYRKAVIEEIRKTYPDTAVIMEVNMVKRR